MPQADRDMNITIIVVIVERTSWRDCQTGSDHAEANMALALKKRRYRWSPQEVTAPTIATRENQHFKGAFLFEWGAACGTPLEFRGRSLSEPQLQV
jgi:hypothetical protein